MLFQPVGEALVQGRPRRLGQSFIGCVANQEVPEPVGVLAANLRLIRTNELLADKAS
jgi:hypothetical protein